jgi:hypothetical protein
MARVKSTCSPAHTRGARVRLAFKAAGAAAPRRGGRVAVMRVGGAAAAGTLVVWSDGVCVGTCDGACGAFGDAEGGEGVCTVVVAADGVETAFARDASGAWTDGGHLWMSPAAGDENLQMIV